MTDEEWRVKLDDGTVVTRSHTEYILLKDVKTLLQRNSVLIFGLIGMTVLVVIMIILLLTNTGIIGGYLSRAIC